MADFDIHSCTGIRIEKWMPYNNNCIQINIKHNSRGRLEGSDEHGVIEDTSTVTLFGLPDKVIHALMRALEDEETRTVTER